MIKTKKGISPKGFLIGTIIIILAFALIMFLWYKLGGEGSGAFAYIKNLFRFGGDSAYG